MANTASAAKAARQSKRKREHNQFWKRSIKSTIKSLTELLNAKPENSDILKTELSKLQKVLDKAVKNKVIHKNKADRLKAKYARKAAVQAEKPEKSKPKPATVRKSKS